MKRYRTFPFSRDAVEILWVGTGAPPADVAGMLAAFDAEDQQEEIELAKVRSQNAACALARAAIQRAQCGVGAPR